VTVADDVGARAEGDVGLDELELGAGLELVVRGAADPSTEDERPRSPAGGRANSEQLRKPPAVSARKDVVVTPRPPRERALEQAADG
jgi:hypothetical protein